MARRSKTPAVLPPAPPVATPLVLPAELTIYAVGELHPQWLAWLGEGTPALPADVAAEVHAAAVDQVDGAGLQLLLSLQRALAARGRQLQIQAPSEVLRNGCAALGLGAWLQAQMTEGAPA